MAQIDLKNATIRLKDRYSNTGAVNLMAGYAIGIGTMLVDTITGEIHNGAYFTIAGDDTIYTVTDHTETLGSTTSITFTPVLAAMAANNAVITFGHRLEVKIGEGNLTYDEKRNMTYTLDRGIIDTVKEGDEVPMDVKMDFTWEFLKADTDATPTIEDVLKNRGEAADWVSSSADACEPYAVDIEVEYVPPCGSENNEVITLPDFRWEQLSHDLKQGTVSVTGKCNSKQASIERVAA